MKKFLMFLLMIILILSVGIGIFSIIVSIGEKKNESSIKPYFRDGILGTRHWRGKEREDAYAIYFYLVKLVCF